ncbi:hypothetical protein ACFT7S_06375 [Streptomyces sp. NPDC057136]|uniref:hypothetical protein n=1 Tax=Streptomyces sp. NPDC057136 TaxID=3346029 RepID=UPI0036272C49
MGLLVGVASLTVAITRSTSAGHLRRAGALAPRIGGGLLLLITPLLAVLLLVAWLIHRRRAIGPYW